VRRATNFAVVVGCGFGELPSYWYLSTANSTSIVW
jgi:hypothetical protein